MQVFDILRCWIQNSNGTLTVKDHVVATLLKIERNIL